MPYQFVTQCAICAKQFGIIWVMDLTRFGLQTVARITCPLCGKRFQPRCQRPSSSRLSDTEPRRWSSRAERGSRL